MKTNQMLVVMLVVLIVTLSQQAKAFYSSSTGRWLSRDPIEERGGANLAAILSNDAVNFVDLDGLMSVESCRYHRDVALSQNPKALRIMAELNKLKCNNPAPACSNCGSGCQGGYTQRANGLITICADNQLTPEDIQTALIHELVHSLDTCRNSYNEKLSCDELICWEIRAYSEDGGCGKNGADRQPNETFRQCVERKAQLGGWLKKCSRDMKDLMKKCFLSKL